MSDKGNLVLEDGSCYEGTLIGTGKSCAGEVVFNTCMTGYQEVISDPSVTGQIVMMAYPLIGNSGINEDYSESSHYAKGVILNELCKEPSNWSSKETLDKFLSDKGITGITGVDVRSIIAKIRDKGTMRGMITKEKPDGGLINNIKFFQNSISISEVSVKDIYLIKGDRKGSIAVLDLGISKSVLKALSKFGYDISVYPALTSYEVILNSAHLGLVIAGGPENFEEKDQIIRNIKGIMGKVPLFGIGSGHQLMALSRGGRIIKLKYGHRNNNHPIKEIKGGRVFTALQNHGYTVEDGDIIGGRVSHINLNDNTVEGICYPDDNAFSVQFYPEDSVYMTEPENLYIKFIAMREGD